MAVSDQHRRVWARQIEALRRIEQPEGAEVTGEARTSLIDWINAFRRADGTRSLVNDEDDCPELGFHRIAAQIQADAARND